MVEKGNNDHNQGLRIKREDSGKRTDQGTEEDKSRGRRFIAFTWGEKG